MGASVPKRRNKITESKERSNAAKEKSHKFRGACRLSETNTILYHTQRRPFVWYFEKAKFNHGISPRLFLFNLSIPVHACLLKESDHVKKNRTK